MFSAAFGPVLSGPGQQPPNPSGPPGVCCAPVQDVFVGVEGIGAGVVDVVGIVG